jgi:protein-S-isoprenylcysteine O-methyltransferase Ste14
MTCSYYILTFFEIIKLMSSLVSILVHEYDSKIYYYTSFPRRLRTVVFVIAVSCPTWFSSSSASKSFVVNKVVVVVIIDVLSHFGSRARLIRIAASSEPQRDLLAYG